MSCFFGGLLEATFWGTQEKKVPHIVQHQNAPSPMWQRQLKTLQSRAMFLVQANISKNSWYTGLSSSIVHLFRISAIVPRPDGKAVASPDEARVLWAKGGYDILDVRSDFEREDRGPIRAEKGSVNIPEQAILPSHCAVFLFIPDAACCSRSNFFFFRKRCLKQSQLLEEVNSWEHPPSVTPGDGVATYSLAHRPGSQNHR